MNKTLYDILQLQPNASAHDIKKAFRALSMKYHPDKNNNSSESVDLIQKINNAYEILGDSDKRKTYDKTIKSNCNLKKNNTENNESININKNENINNENMLKLFKKVFEKKINTLEKPIPIIKTIVIQLEQVLESFLYPLEIKRWIIENEAKVFENETIYIDIPQSIDDNELIILKEKGNIINDICKGDIKLFIKIENNTLFERNGLDLILNKSISLKESLCGFTFNINFINGKTYTINNIQGTITPPNYKKIIPNMGLCRVGNCQNNCYGNLIILFTIEYPTQLNSEVISTLNNILQ